jgi:ribosomal-protein-alanine N-acetyltransferase
LYIALKWFMLTLCFDPYPTLITERLILRRPLATDDKETFAIRADKELNKYVDRPLAKSVEDARNFLQKLNGCIDRNESISWVITLKGDNKLLGSICFWNILRETGTAEIGFELIPRHQGQGIMTEATRGVLAYGFNEMHLNTVEGWVHKDNERSIKLILRFGFERDLHAESRHTGKDYFDNMIIYTLKKATQPG